MQNAKLKMYNHENHEKDEKYFIEMKAVSEISDIQRALLLKYLKATGLELGLLVNFSSYTKIAIERIVSWSKKFMKLTR